MLKQIELLVIMGSGQAADKTIRLLTERCACDRTLVTAPASTLRADRFTPTLSAQQTSAKINRQSADYGLINS